MRLLILAAVVMFVLALICLAVPTVVAGAKWEVWLVAGLLSWALDTLLGGVTTLTVNRPAKEG